MFDTDSLLDCIARTDHVLWRVNKPIEWERFRRTIDNVFAIEQNGPDGRPPQDRMMLFRVPIIKYFYDIPDGQREYRLLGDLYFRLFPGLHMGDPTPDEKMIWLFQHPLSDARIMLELFAAFDTRLNERRMVAKKGRLVDASIVPDPTQHLSRKDHGTLEAGNLPVAWKENPSIARQRDTDAAWVK